MPSLSKEVMLREVIGTLQDKNYIFFARHQGLSATDFVEIRQKLQKVADRALVVKNTILRLAFKKVGIQDANGLVKGSLLLAVGSRDPQNIAKVLVDFAKAREHFHLDGAYLDGQIVLPQFLKSLAELPPREVLIALVVGGLNAPIGGFVTVLGQLIRSLAITLDQIQKQKVT